jgi:hypothetical protein
MISPGYSCGIPEKGKHSLLPPPAVTSPTLSDPLQYYEEESAPEIQNQEELQTNSVWLYRTAWFYFSFPASDFPDFNKY